MDSNNELSDRRNKTIMLWPQHLLCMQCMNGGGCLEFMEKYKLKAILNAIKHNNNIHLRLEGAFDEIGARTEIFYEQTHEEKKRDLDVIQKLGLAMGDTRTARDLFSLINERIFNINEICEYNAAYGGEWHECPLARTNCWQRGSKIITEIRSEAEMQQYKISSCKGIEEADHIKIRAHHLLCIVCFIGRDDNDKPIPEDNLYEVWMKMRNNPDISVTVIEGPSECMICPPCHSYNPERGICIATCHLRDRKKDLDTMMKLGIKPGDTLPAKEIINRIYKFIPTVIGLCSYDTVTSPEWSCCGNAKTGRFENGLKKGIL